MNFEQIKPESERARGVREAMINIQDFKDRKSITPKQFHEQAQSISRTIVELINENDPSATELAERFKANFPYDIVGL